MSTETNTINVEEKSVTSPSIRATFNLDDAGRPKMITTGSIKHYEIQLHVDGTPEDTYAVTYLLDPSYHSQVREVLDSKEGFQEQLTSFGDYTVQAKIRTRDGVMTVALPLSTALARSYGDAPSQPIASALQDMASR